jgi:hypothetical protein
LDEGLTGLSVPAERRVGVVKPGQLRISAHSGRWPQRVLRHDSGRVVRVREDPHAVTASITVKSARAATTALQTSARCSTRSTVTRCIASSISYRMRHSACLEGTVRAMVDGYTWTRYWAPTLRGGF